MALKLPFVRRSKYERVKADLKQYREASDFKQKILMHYRAKYWELWHLINQPRAKNGRYIEKVTFTK